MNLSVKLSRVFVVLLTLAIFMGCKKEEGPEVDLGSGGEVSMEIDGKPFSFKFTAMTTNYEDAVDDGDEYFNVVATAGHIDITGNEEVGKSESLMFIITLPVSKFKDPRGTYEVGDSEESYPVQIVFWKNIGVGDNSKIEAYGSFEGSDRRNSAGTFTIESFKIGKQKVLFEEMGEGYLELKGKFEADLFLWYASDADAEGIADKVSIKKANFTLKYLSFNFLDFIN